MDIINELPRVRMQESVKAGYLKTAVYCADTDSYIVGDSRADCERMLRGEEPTGIKKQGRMMGRIAVVTGAAQGFGRGIAEVLAKEGAYIAVADLNIDGAEAFAGELCERYGEGSAFAVRADVSDEESVEQMVLETVKHYGGIDLYVSCAGLSRPGGIEEVDRKFFELITAVNYTGYWLGVKYVSRVMKAQRAAAPDYMMDIIEINSKSGLEGSNRNFTYSGSKFGGIGLTQSFALELAGDGIKVNAVCPGNYLDGPMWSNPEKGLFKLFLEAGKVPGAKTVEDVRKFYEAKVPLGRGCLPTDVARAILYCVEQKYETGQAIPVTGGQTMLN